ncbi:hypothetical protein Ciccas_006860 [Cichlidogyrus casuarinus]|uniref:EF-hand domain-containing protein n=1 Tax=Cichlidogyrus casuarinus TaxID=1844966 RepID=A0ABD2Q555_9PLAT
MNLSEEVKKKFVLQLFDKIDKNRTNSILPIELLDYINSKGNTYSIEDAKLFVKRYDLNQTGSLTRREFRHLCEDCEIIQRQEEEEEDDVAAP